MLGLTLKASIAIAFMWPCTLSEPLDDEEWTEPLAVRKWIELILAILLVYGIADWTSTISQIVLACDHFSHLHKLHALSTQVYIYRVASGAC